MGKQKILCTCSSSLFLEQIKSIAKEERYEVIYSKDVTEALFKSNNQSFDLWIIHSDDPNYYETNKKRIITASSTNFKILAFSKLEIDIEEYSYECPRLKFFFNKNKDQEITHIINESLEPEVKKSNSTSKKDTLNILLADDIEINRELIVDFLDSFKCKVYQAVD